MKQHRAPVRGLLALRGALAALAVCLALAVCAKPASAQPAADESDANSAWNFKKPLQICTASIQDFGARCNGNSGVPSFDKEVAPLGPVPPEGWCAAGDDFCGYDIDVWRRVVDIVGLQEGRDYEHVCLGENGFGYMIENLARTNNSLPAQCDMGVSSITASVEREATGIQFSRTTHRSALAVMVYAPLKQRGMWAFFEPLHVSVWMALVFTVIVTPFFVFFFESVFSKRSAYTADGGRLHIWHGITESLWHSVSHTLSIDVFKVHAFPSRLITAAYAFLVLILTNTYTANLAAFLTVDQLDTQISDVNDLRGKAVVTVAPYVDRLYSNHRIVATDKEGWDYETMIERLKNKVYTAVISDDTQLITRAYSDDSCSLHILSESVEPFDLAFAYSKDFEYPGLQEAVSSAILKLQESGVLEDIKAEHQPPTPSCLANTEFSETNQVPIESLWGLWVILSVAIGLAGIVGLIDYELKRRRRSDKVVEIEERAIVFKRALTKSVSFAAPRGSMHRAGGSSHYRIDSSRGSSMEDVDGFVRSGRAGSLRDSTPMGSMHDGMACLEVVTESHEEASPKSGVLRGTDSQMKRMSNGGASAEKQRNKARVEAAAAAAAAAVAEEEAHSAAATAAAVEASDASSSRQRDKARCEAAAAAAAAAIAAEEASASRALLSARIDGAAAGGGDGGPTASAFSASGAVRTSSATLGLQPASARANTACFIPPDYDESATHHDSARPTLAPSSSLRALQNPHQQPSFGRSISTVSVRSGTTQPPEGEESDIGSHARGANVGPASLAVSAAPSGTESGGDFTRGSASDCVRSDVHNGCTAPSPPNAPQSPINAREDSEAAGTEAFGMESSDGVMRMAMQRLPGGLAGSPIGSPHAGGAGPLVPPLLQLPQTHTPRALGDGPSHSELRSNDGNNANHRSSANAALDLQLASIRSDGSQMLSMPPSMGAAPAPLASPPASRISGDQNSSNAFRGTTEGCAAQPSLGCCRISSGNGAQGGSKGAQGCCGVPVVTGHYMHGSRTRVQAVEAEEEMEKQEDMDAELERLQELVQHVAIRVESLMKRRNRQ